MLAIPPGLYKQYMSFIQLQLDLPAVHVPHLSRWKKHPTCRCAHFMDKTSLIRSPSTTPTIHHSCYFGKNLWKFSAGQTPTEERERKVNNSWSTTWNILFFHRYCPTHWTSLAIIFHISSILSILVFIFLTSDVSSSFIPASMNITFFTGKSVPKV